jgi:hypothetical protein
MSKIRKTLLTFAIAAAAGLASSGAYACKPMPGCWTDYAESDPGYFRAGCQQYAGGLTVAEIASFLNEDGATVDDIENFLRACGKLRIHERNVIAMSGSTKIIPENWAPCATGIQRDEPSFDEIPAWANTKELRPYYDSDPRLLANHGLCNAKFHRVLLCLPGWQEDHDGSPEFRVCQAWERRGRARQ